MYKKLSNLERNEENCYSTPRFRVFFAFIMCGKQEEV